jgi:long-chain acyl-CoA synthetase
VPVALGTSGTSGAPRAVVRSTGSWVDSFAHVSALTGLDGRSRVWVPGPPAATMNLFAAVHARWAGAELVASPRDATHAHLTPTALHRLLDDGAAPPGLTVVVAGDRLDNALGARATDAGLEVHHYYGAAELSFVAWGREPGALTPFPGVEVEVRDSDIWVRSH